MYFEETTKIEIKPSPHKTVPKSLNKKKLKKRQAINQGE
jgi:hypothetical protein